MGKKGEIQSIPYHKKNETWKQKKLIDSGKKGYPIPSLGSNANHAEMLVLKCLNDSDRQDLLLVQNEFPCEHCHKVFMAISITINITVEVQNESKDSLGYRSAHPGCNLPDLPLYILYESGHPTYVAGTMLGAMIGF
jgi:hypothetical protein